MKYLIDEDTWASELEELQRELYRVMSSVWQMSRLTIAVNDRTAINFSSKNYFGLAGHTAVMQVFVDCVNRYEAGLIELWASLKID